MEESVEDCNDEQIKEGFTHEILFKDITREHLEGFLSEVINQGERI